jgi:hypothetical protein
MGVMGCSTGGAYDITYEQCLVFVACSIDKCKWCRARASCVTMSMSLLRCLGLVLFRNEMKLVTTP